MKKSIVLFAISTFALLCISRHSFAQALSQDERYAAMDNNRVFLAMADEYIVSDVLEAEGLKDRCAKKVPVAIYKVVKPNAYYGDTYCYGYLFGKEVKLSLGYYLSFVSDDDYQYLVSRGVLGEDARKEAAKRFDKVQSAEFKKEVKSLIEKERGESQELLQYLRRNRAIISNYSVSESYSDYSLKLEINNWFAKRIKYVDLTVMAVNSVGDPRWYDRGRTVKNIQCIGYIESLSSGTYKFDDLFYDSSEVIDDIIVCGAVITFEDNSKITINSQDAAAKMYVRNHNIEFPNNFYQYIR